MTGLAIQTLTLNQTPPTKKKRGGWGDPNPQGLAFSFPPQCLSIFLIVEEVQADETGKLKTSIVSNL